jgi:stage V sporulation protein B
LGFVFKIYVARVFGAETIGLYQISISVLSLLFAFAASGISPILSRRVAELTALNDGKKADSLLAASVIIVAALSTIIVVLSYIFRDYIGVLFSDKRSEPMFLIMLPILVSTSIYACIRSWFWGRREYLTFSFTEFMEELFRLLFTILLAAGIFGVFSGQNAIAIAVVSADFFSLFVLAFIFFKRGGKMGKPAEFKNLTKRSLPLTAVRISGGFVSSFTALIIPSRLIASGMSTAEATAVYGRVAGMALPLIMVPTMLVGALAVVLIPEIAAAHAAKRIKSVEKRVQSSLLFTVLTASIFVTLYIPLGQHISRILFNDAEAGTFVQLAAALIFPISINQISNTILNSLGMEKNTFFHYVAGAVVLIPILVFLPGVIGIYAIAAGTFACFALTSVLNIIKIKKKLGTRVIDIKKSVLTLIFTIGCTALGWFLQSLLSRYVGDVFVVIAVTLVCGGLFAACVQIFKIASIKSIFVRKGGQKKPVPVDAGGHGIITLSTRRGSLLRRADKRRRDL